MSTNIFGFGCQMSASYLLVTLRHMVFPAVETARFEIGRDPQLMLESVQEAIDLQPNAIIPGHSRILDDPAEIQELMGLTRDAIQFLIDQVDRFYLSDRSIDDLLDTLQLPPAIANHPDSSPITTAGSG